MERERQQKDRVKMSLILDYKIIGGGGDGDGKVLAVDGGCVV